jgi:hypothetical protein
LRAISPRIDEHLARLADDAAELPGDPIREALLDATGVPPARGALDDLRRAAAAFDRKARIRVGPDRLARWDVEGGLVITSLRDNRPDDEE